MSNRYTALVNELFPDGNTAGLLTTEGGLPRLLLSVDEAATILGIPKSTLYDKIQAGDFPAITIFEGNHKRVPVDELVRWVAERKAERDERVRLARQGKRGWRTLAGRKAS
jgi:excisionase family DNA binding protein